MNKQSIVRKIYMGVMRKFSGYGKDEKKCEAL